MIDERENNHHEKEKRMKKLGLSKLFIIVVFISVVVSTVRADKITLHNKTDKDLFARVYYRKLGDQQVTSIDKQGQKMPILFIPAQQSITVERPKKWRYSLFPIKHYDRELVFVFNQTDVQNTVLDMQVYKQLPHSNIGWRHGSSYYLALKDGALKGYTKAGWNIIRPTIGAVKTVAQKVRKSIMGKSAAIEDNPYKDTVATVRVGNELSPGERAFTAKRLTKVKQALEKLFDKKLTNIQVPKIAFVSSGGGYRAMVGLSGTMAAAEETGILDTVMWLLGLSGSAWYVSNYAARPDSAKKFQTILQKNVSKKFLEMSKQQMNQLLDAIQVKFAFEQTITAVDGFGGFLIKNLLGDLPGDPNQIYLSEQTKYIDQGQKPYPICTAIESRSGVKPVWYEFTPHEVGSAIHGLYVPIWALGRRFSDGNSIDFAPEQSPGFYYGSYGSAFAATSGRMMEEVYKGLGDRSEGMQLIDTIFKKMGKSKTVIQIVGTLGQKRVVRSWGEVFNYTLGMPKSSIRYQKSLKFSDAGLDSNFPYKPISGERPERKADIIFIFDHTGGIQRLGPMKATERFARNKGLKFPEVNYDELLTRPVTVLENLADPEMPTVIYIPLYRTTQVAPFDPVGCTVKSYCSSTNFKYTKEQFYELSNFTQNAFKSNIEEIKAAIERWVDSRADQKESSGNLERAERGELPLNPVVQ